MSNVLIIGATSTIAEMVARHYAEQGDRLYLTGRNLPHLESIATDLRIRGARQVTLASLDVDDASRHEEVIGEAWRTLEGCDIALIAHGTLPQQEQIEQDREATLAAFQTNAFSTISLLTLLANRFSEQGSGTLAVISSVAADRIRRSNYIYGTAKLAVNGYLEGLRLRLEPEGVEVVTLKPGFVDTAMTRDFSKGPLWAQPQQVAGGIVRAIERGSSSAYIPWFWWFIMAVIRWLPGPIFRRLKI